MNNIIIIGAPRSGTNMLRDVLASLDDIGTWPCDEINYIWRHGNINYPSDAIPPCYASSDVIKYIRQQFQAQQQRLKTHILLEKTCANSLRVLFVDKVIPDAKYIYIHRDGIDAAFSAKVRWTAALDLAYIFKKVRFVPKSDLLIYGSRYLGSRIYRLFSKEKRLAFWGPKLHDMESLLMSHSLIEVCLIQWQRCVEAAEDAFATIPSNRILRVSYETFVHDPAPELERILSFLNYTCSKGQIDDAIANVSTRSIAKGRQALGNDQVHQLEQLVYKSLNRYGYV